MSEKNLIDYCQKCLCPLKYCSELVFGEKIFYHVIKHARFEGIYEYGDSEDLDRNEVYEKRFESVFNSLIFSKSITNCIDLGHSSLHYDSNNEIPLPECIKEGSFSAFKDWIEKEIYCIEVGFGEHTSDWEPTKTLIDYFREDSD